MPRDLMGRHLLWLSPLPGCGNSSQSPALFEALSLFTKFPSLSSIFHIRILRLQGDAEISASHHVVSLPLTHAVCRGDVQCAFSCMISASHLPTFVTFPSLRGSVHGGEKHNRTSCPGFESLFHLKCDLRQVM